MPSTRKYFVIYFNFVAIASSSLQFEPVGRWYEANIHRRQHGLSSHHSSSSASSSASSEAGYSSDEEDHRFLLTLDPTDWKVKCFEWSCTIWERVSSILWTQFNKLFKVKWSTSKVNYKKFVKHPNIPQEMPRIEQKLHFPSYCLRDLVAYSHT